MRKYPRILYFVVGTLPTEADHDEAENMGPNVAFRNADMVPAEGALEICDGVAGKVPQRYADAYPSAREAIEKYITEEQDRRQRKFNASAEISTPVADNVGNEPKQSKTSAKAAQPTAQPAGWTPN